MTTSVSTQYAAVAASLQRTPAYVIRFTGIDAVYGTHTLVSEETDIDDSVDIDFTLDLDKAYDLDTGAEQFYHDIFDGNAFTPVLDYMKLPQGVSAQIEPDKGRASIGSVTFVIEDIGGAATQLIAYGIGGRVCTLKAGFDNILESEFATFFTGIVAGYKLTDDLTGYEITVRDPATLANKQIFETAATQTTAALTGSATDTWLHVFTALVTGSTVNSTTTTLNVAAITAAFDASFGAGNYTIISSTPSIGSTVTVSDTQFFLPAGYVQLDDEIIAYTTKTATTFTGLTRGSLGTTAAAHVVGTSAQELLRIGPGHLCDLVVGIYENTNKTGCSIPAALIDTATFTAVKASMGTANFEWRIKGRVNAKTFLEDQAFGVASCYPIITGAGLLSIREFAEPASTDSVATIDHDSIVADSDGKPMLGWDGNFSKLYNKVTVKYDYDASSTADDPYGSSYTDSNAASIATFGEAPLVILAQGLRSDLAGTLAFIQSRTALILQRYANTAPLVHCTTFLQKNLIEPGEVVSVTSDLLPNRYTATRGVTAGLFEVIGREMNFARGQVIFLLLWTGFSLLDHDDFDRPDTDWDIEHSLGTDPPLAMWAGDSGCLHLPAIVSHQLVMGYDGVFGTGANFLYVPVSVAASDNQISELEFVSAAAGKSGPMVRMSNSGGTLNATGYLANYDPTNTRIQLLKYFATPLTGGATILDSYTVTLAAGDKLRIHASGTTITVLVNSVIVITATDIDISGGQPGAASTKATGTITWDNWRGGSDGWN